MDIETANKLYEIINNLKELSARKDEIIDELVQYVDSLEQENAMLRKEIDSIGR